MTKKNFTSIVLALVLIFSASSRCYSSTVILSSTKGWSEPTGRSLNGVIGTWNAEMKSATLTTNLRQSIRVLTSNIRLDGNGHTVTGCIDTPELCSREIGIEIDGVSDLTINDLAISKFKVGILMKNSSAVKISRIHLSRNKTAINIDSINGSEITDSSLVNNDMGATIHNCKTWNTFSNNIISRNRWHGLKFTKTWGNNITGNTFEKNGMTGILFANSCYYNNCNENNLLFNGRFGILLSVNTGVNFVFRNNFIGNRYKHIWSIRSNYFSQPPPIGGNYWGEGEYEKFPRSESPMISSPWSTPDYNGDGIVDKPYPIFSLYSSAVLSYDEFPWATKNGWLNYNVTQGQDQKNVPLLYPDTGFQTDTFQDD